MTRSKSYTSDHRNQLHRAFLDGIPLHCPECGAALDRRAVPPRKDVSYVRERLWVSCPACQRTTVLDRREPR